MKRIALFGLLFLTLQAGAQEVLTDLTCNPQLVDYYRTHAQQRVSHIPTIQDTLPLPFHDDFSYGQFVPDTARWADQQAWVYVNRGLAKAPLNIGVATFDGLNAVGYPYNFLVGPTSSGPADKLTSKPIDLSGLTANDSVYMSFYYQPKGFGNAPEAADTFLLQFHIPQWGNANNDSAWKTVWYKEGFTPSSSDSSFYRVMLRLDSAYYFVKGFTFRFKNYATLSGSVDHWHLDEVKLDKNRNMNDTLLREVRFVYNMPSMLKYRYTAMPWWRYKPGAWQATNVKLFIRNNDPFDKHITSSNFKIRHANGSLYQTSTAAAGSVVVPPYDSANTYYNDAPVTNPSVYPSYDFTNNLADSTYFTVDYFLQPDSGLASDSVRVNQRFYNYYSYDDGTAEAGYGLNQQYARLAYQFTMLPGDQDTLKAIQMFFNPLTVDVSSRTFRLTVWADAGGHPGNVIYQQMNESPHYVAEAYNRFTTYTIDSGIVVLSGTYYIGWMQDAVDLLNIGFDMNTNTSDRIFYNLTGTWYNTIYKGSLMMRPLFNYSYNVSGVEEQTNALSSLSVYPNPAENEVFVNASGSLLSGLRVSVYDLSGRLLNEALVQENRIDVSALQDGVYLLRFADAAGAVSTKRVVIAR